jgi:hypothetical protein
MNIKIYMREYRLKNKEKLRKYKKLYARKWRNKNPDRVKESNHSEANRIRQAKYREKHREEIRKRNLAYNKRKIETDLNARLIWLLRSRVNGAIKKCEGIKAYKTMDLVGCGIQELREYLEKKFTLEMTWENHGEIWEIDHIIPISSFNLIKPEEQKKCFHYTNLQPLNWKENRLKSNKMMI